MQNMHICTYIYPCVSTDGLRHRIARLALTSRVVGRAGFSPGRYLGAMRSGMARCWWATS